MNEDLHKSNIIDIDFLYFFLLVKVEGEPLFLLLFVTLRWRLALALTLIVALHELNPAGRSILVLVYFEVLRNFPLSFELPYFVRKVFEDDVAFFILELS